MVIIENYFRGEVFGTWDTDKQEWVGEPKPIREAGIYSYKEEIIINVDDVLECFDGEPIEDKAAFAANPLVQLVIGGRTDLNLTAKKLLRISNDVKKLIESGIIKEVPAQRLTLRLVEWAEELGISLE